MKDIFKVHEVARVKSGKDAGLVGVIVDTRPDGLRLLVEGVSDGEAFRREFWVRASAVERLT